MNTKSADTEKFIRPKGSVDCGAGKGVGCVLEFDQHAWALLGAALFCLLLLQLAAFRIMFLARLTALMSIGMFGCEALLDDIK